jgi:hypothetical protein
LPSAASRARPHLAAFVASALLPAWLCRATSLEVEDAVEPRWATSTSCLPAYTTRRWTRRNRRWEKGGGGGGGVGRCRAVEEDALTPAPHEGGVKDEGARATGGECWGYPKIRIRCPNTREENTQTFKSEAQMTQDETKNLLKTAHASKVVNSFTRVLTPPFIGRRRDFHIPKVPSNLRHIPNVNMYMKVFHFPYIYKPATSSHIKLGLLR